MKKTIALTLMLVMIMSTVCFAAVSSSGSRSSSSGSSKSSSTSTPSSSTKTAPASSGDYKPSAAPNSYSEKAPVKPATPSVQPNTQSQSTGSSFWRNASMFGGGMLAGSMLGSLFGSNNMGGMGGGSSLFGMLLNLLIIGGMVMGARYLWNKYKNKDRDIR